MIKQQRHFYKAKIFQKVNKLKPAALLYSLINNVFLKTMSSMLFKLYQTKGLRNAQLTHSCKVIHNK